MVEMHGLVKRYGELRALDEISLSIEPGDFFGLLGPNGAGKSTLVSCLTGYQHPDAGEIRYAGARFEPHRHDQRRLYGLVPQQIALYGNLTARENLHLFGRFYQLSHREVGQRATELLEQVGLADRQKEPIRHFSGGMQRRLNLAASLMHRPRILYCDEPTVGVDPQSRLAVFTLLEQLNAEGMTIVYTSHYMEEVTRLCRRLAIVDHGRVLAEGSLTDLLARREARRSLRLPADLLTPARVARLECFGELVPLPDQRHYRLQPHASFDAAAFFQAAQAEGIDPWAVAFEQGSLEDLFLALTGRSLRDA